MKSVMILSVLVVGMTSLTSFAEETKPAPAASYSNLLPTEKDLEKSTAQSEAKAKAEKDKAARTGVAPALPKSKSKLALSSTCKDSQGKSYVSTDIGYDACMQQANVQAQLRRQNSGMSSATGTSTSTGGAGFQFKVGE